MMQPDSMVRSIRFANVMDRSRYKFGGKLALFMRFGTFFYDESKAREDEMFVLTLLFLFKSKS